MNGIQQRVATVLAALAAIGMLCVGTGASMPSSGAARPFQVSSPRATMPARGSTVSTAPTRVAYTWDPGYAGFSRGKLAFRTPDPNLTVCGHDTAGYPKLSIDPPAGASSPTSVALIPHCDVYGSGGMFVSVVWADVTIKTHGVWTVRVAWNGGIDRDSFAFVYAPNAPQITALAASRQVVSFKDCVNATTAPVTISWTTTNASTVTLSSPAGTQGVPASGSLPVAFPCDGLGHDYVLSASGLGGNTAKTLRVGFLPSTPQIIEFLSEPTSVSPRFCATAGPHQLKLSWRTVDASEVTITGPGFAVATNEPAGTRTFPFTCDGQPHDYTLTARGYLGTAAPTTARTVTVRQVGASVGAVCKYALSANHNWVPTTGVHVGLVSGSVIWLDPTGATMPSLPADFSPPGGTTLRAGPQPANVTLQAGSSQVRLDLTPGTQLQFGVPEDPWSWIELNGTGATLVRITNTPEPSPGIVHPGIPGPQGCVITDVATTFELQADPHALTVRAFQDSLEVGDRAANPGGKLPIETVSAGRVATINASGNPSSPARMTPADYQQIARRYGVKFPVPADLQTRGTNWWIWATIAAVMLIALGVGGLLVGRRRNRPTPSA